MKLKVLLLAGGLALFSAGDVYAQVYVHGYTRKDGTYVQPHYRSNPDGNPYNNWSTSGNVNPYTGKEGHRNPESSSSHSYGFGGSSGGGYGSTLGGDDSDGYNRSLGE